MGHREALLAGAKRCLYERGYARTTARDVVAASGTNLASIGYHFGSKEALLTQAMIEAFAEWGDELGQVLSTRTDGGPLEQLESIWTGLIESLDKHRPLWIASFEAFSQAERVPELRGKLAAGYEQGRLGLAALFLKLDESTVDEKTARTVGSLLAALQSGLTVQWLLDPERAPSGGDLAEGLRRILAAVEADRPEVGE